MWRRLKLWFARPGHDASPAETFRWVRRLALAMAALSALIGVRRLITGDAFAWLGIASAGLLLLSALALTAAIRSADR